MTPVETSGIVHPGMQAITGHVDIRPYIPDRIATAMRLNGNVTGVEPLRFGMSGNDIVRVDTHTGSLVVKFSDSDPRKVHQEIDRHRRLIDTPLEPFIPPMLHSSTEHGFVAYPFYPGLQVREGVRARTIDGTSAMRALGELLDIKQSWWAGQRQEKNPTEFVSMQREEWPDTMKGIGKTVDSLEKRFGVSSRDILEKPVVFEGRRYDPLQRVITRVGTFLAENPPYAITAHNDATGANMILNQDSSWKLLDPEWTGPSDPAEAYMRMVKYITSATAGEVTHASLNADEDTLQTDIQVAFPQTAIDLQNEGIMRRDAMAHALHDETFIARSSLYLSGSYLRELALATKRGNPDLALFTIIKAAEALELR